MENRELFSKAILHLDEVISQETEQGKELRSRLEQLHPADLSYFFSLLDDEGSRKLFLSLNEDLQASVFTEFSNARKVIYLSFLDEQRLRSILLQLDVDDLMDFFDELSDEEVEKYLKLIQKKDRDQIVSLLQQEPESAGRHMEVNVLALIADFSVEKSIQLLRRLQPDQELHRLIFVTSREGQLEGYIMLEDLVLQKPETRISSIVRPAAFEVQVDDDREEVARKMMHYNVTTAPVVDARRTFLGIISSEALVDIMEEESSEDIFRMATVSPIKDSYFETPFVQLLYKRGAILIILLFVQSVTSTIIAHYQLLLAGFLFQFISMLGSTGGNTSSQTSAFIIQGVATGEINDQNVHRFLRREILMASAIAAILGGLAFIRVFFGHPTQFWPSVAVSCSLMAIVVISMTLGGLIPLVLRRFNIDPAHSAGPLLATLMDVIGILVFCVISSWILGG